jgi:hypothetical protein
MIEVVENSNSKHFQNPNFVDVKIYDQQNKITEMDTKRCHPESKQPAKDQ